MKHIFLLILIFNTLSYAYFSKSQFINSLTSRQKFNNNLSLERNTLRNPLRLFKLDREGQLRVKAKFIWRKSELDTGNGSDKKSEDRTKQPLETFDYKLIQFSETEITIFSIDQFAEEFDENSSNASKYLMSIKYQTIDLPCNENFYVCSLGEFISEYREKIKIC